MGSGVSGLYSGTYGSKPSLPESYLAEAFYIGRSLGCASLNYNVYDSKGRSYRFIEGTAIENPTVFAGKGTRNKLKQEVSYGLSKQYGGKPRNWKHSKGIGNLDYHGRSRKAEVHWFEEPSVGKIKFRIKRWLE